MDVPTLYRLFVVWEAAAVLRHDVRNKLASVRNATFYLRRKVESDAIELWSKDKRIPTFFELIGKELEGADVIISTRVPSVGGEPQGAPIGIAEVLAGARENLCPPTGVNVRFPDEHIVVQGDREELTIAMFCLLENAIEACASSGEGTVAVGARADGDRVILTIEDDGPGLGVEPRRALEHFYTTKPRRLGLGLKIARRLIQRARGTLELADREGRGVLVTIALPRGAS